MIHRPTEPELLAAMHARLRARVVQYGSRSLIETRPAVDEERRALRTCHRVSSYERRRGEPPRDSGAYVPEMAARLEDDPNLTDGARRCARKIAEYAYRKNRKGRSAEITVTYLMRALRKCRRTVQRYLRQLEREGYIRVDIVHGGRSRMCVGLIVHLQAMIFPRHHREKWPQKSMTPDATAESQNKRFKDRSQTIPLEAWALRCSEGVFRSLLKTLTPLPSTP